MSLIVVSLLSAHAYIAGVSRTLPGSAAIRTHSVTMFNEEMREKAELAAPKIKTLTRSRESPVRDSKTGGTVIVTDGSDSFYKNRNMVQVLHDFGTFGQITAFSSSVADSKKMLLSRQSRYSGLNDVLDFAEGDLGAAMAGATTWLAINANEAELPAQIAAAKAAGVGRVFILLSAALADVAAIEGLLTGIDFTIMRTGELVDTPRHAGEGQIKAGGLKLDEVSAPVCEDVPKDDVFRFVTEALTLPEASSRLFSLCPSDATLEPLKQLRYCGYERREEVQMLLAGLIKEQGTEDLSEEEAEEKAEAVLRSNAEIEAEREEEIQALLAKAKERAEIQAKKLAFEEEEKLAHRKEQEKYYNAPLPGEKTDVPGVRDAAPTDAADEPKDADEPKE